MYALFITKILSNSIKEFVTSCVRFGLFRLCAISKFRGYRLEALGAGIECGKGESGCLSFSCEILVALCLPHWHTPTLTCDVREWERSERGSSFYSYENVREWERSKRGCSSYSCESVRDWERSDRGSSYFVWELSHEKIHRAW